MVAIMPGNRRAASVQLEWKFVAGTDLLDKVDSAGLKASQYCDLFNDQETEECNIRNLEIPLNMAIGLLGMSNKITVPTRTFFYDSRSPWQHHFRLVNNLH